MEEATKVVEYEIDETQGAAAIFVRCTLAGYVVIRVDRERTKVVVTYAKV